VACDCHISAQTYTLLLRLPPRNFNGQAVPSACARYQPLGVKITYTTALSLNITPSHTHRCTQSRRLPLILTLHPPPNRHRCLHHGAHARRHGRLCQPHHTRARCGGKDKGWLFSTRSGWIRGSIICIRLRLLGRMHEKGGRCVTVIPQIVYIRVLLLIIPFVQIK
jgi:hypothetical protein